jgi:8-oxo-dGTP pyrophosphatase MutT (NUDIX family)
MGGAVVVPGGKVEADDRAQGWSELGSFPDELPGAWRDDEADARAAFVAACRETLEEACILHTLPPVDGARTRELRGQASQASFANVMRGASLRVDATALVPFARWVTPAAETRRFDTRFFVARCPQGQDGAHDLRETVRSFWAGPAEILRRFDAGEVTLFPPTHRTLEILSGARAVDDAIEIARQACLDPICPRLVPHADGEGSTLALVLPGDPEHEVPVRRVPGGTRYVLRGTAWRSEDAPVNAPRGTPGSR